MKKLLTVLFASVLFLSSCDQLGKLTEIKIPLSEKITIPVIPIAGAETIETPGIKTGIDSVMNDAGISEDLIEDITLSKMDFKMTSMNDDFGFLKSIEVYITSEGKDDVKIAYANDIADVNSLSLTTMDETDIKDFILKEEFGLKVKFETLDPIMSPKEVEIKLEVILDLEVLGL